MNLLGYICWLLAKCIHSMSMLKQENKCWRITFLQEIVIYHLLSLMSFKTCMHFFLSWTWKILWSMSKLLHTEKGHLGLLISIVVKKHHGSSPKVLKDSLFTDKLRLCRRSQISFVVAQGPIFKYATWKHCARFNISYAKCSWFFMLHYSAKLEYLEVWMRIVVEGKNV